MIKAILGCAMLALTAAPGLADVKAGVAAWEQGDYPKAVSDWRAPAIAGDADAQFNLGQAYKLGRGVAPDLTIAEDWYHRAAVQGHFQAEDNYGLTLFQNGKRAEAMPWIAKSAARGEPRAQYVLATSLFNGDLAPKDWVRAYALMTRASASGLGPASSSLAQMDRYIPADQRQKGIVMARDLEAGSRKLMQAPFGGVEPVELGDAKPAPAVQPTELPPSQVAGAPYAAPTPAGAPVALAQASTVAPKPAPKAPVPKPPVAKAPIVKPVVVAAKATPKAPAPKPAIAAGKAWRVQLGAFGADATARSLWATSSSKVAGLHGLQPFLIKAGAVTRLQAGPVASRAAADALCASIKKSGAPCFPVAP